MEKKCLPEDYIPSVKDVEWFLNYWNEHPSYSNHEKSLNKLFFQLCPANDCIEDILIKCSALNDFYSTNIYDISAVARHILSLHIDERLKNHDLSLVRDIAYVEEIGKTYYSFATKYCSHHQPEHYAIYDSYVENVLVSLNMRDKFANFQRREDLKNYSTYMMAINAFQRRYGLQYYIKELDMYLWQLGKWYFNPYGLTYKYYNREGWEPNDCPYAQDDVRSKFWCGEMMFVKQHLPVGKWKEYGKKWLKTAHEQIKQLAGKYTPEQFGVITYISALYGKWCPYDDQEWIVEY